MGRPVKKKKHFQGVDTTPGSVEDTWSGNNGWGVVLMASDGRKGVLEWLVM